MAKRRKNITGLPEAELDSIARVLYSSIIEYCNSEKGKKIMPNGKNNDNLILKIKKCSSVVITGASYMKF